jgi:hypothetical protein
MPTPKPHIRWIEEGDAKGELAGIYKDYMSKTGRPGVAEILKCFSLRPDFLNDVITFSNRVHFTEGHLTIRIKEMLATYVSALNRCKY